MMTSNSWVLGQMGRNLCIIQVLHPPTIGLDAPSVHSFISQSINTKQLSRRDRVC